MSTQIRILPGTSPSRTISISINGIRRDIEVGAVVSVNDDELRLIREAEFSYTYGDDILTPGNELQQMIEDAVDEVASDAADAAAEAVAEALAESATIATWPDGTLATPAYRFTLDPDTGLYRPADDTLSVVAGGTEMIRATKTAGANVVSFGVTPAAWTGGFWAMQLPGAGAYLAWSSASGKIAFNSYWGGANKAISTGAAGTYQFSSGVHEWFTAPSVAADATQTFTLMMQINLAGGVGIGASAGAGTSVRVGKAVTGATSAYALRSDGVIQSDVTSIAIGYGTVLGTQAASFTLSELCHFNASQGTIGAGSAVTTQYGYFANSNLNAAANNYGFYGFLPAGSGRWNFFAGGTANNAFAGNSRFGGTTAPTVAVDVTGAVAATTTIRTGSYTVATLPSASGSGVHARTGVSDANSTTFNAVVAGGGSNIVPVFSDGTNWRIG